MGGVTGGKEGGGEGRGRGGNGGPGAGDAGVVAVGCGDGPGTEWRCPGGGGPGGGGPGEGGRGVVEAVPEKMGVVLVKAVWGGGGRRFGVLCYIL